MQEFPFVKVTIDGRAYWLHDETGRLLPVVRGGDGPTDETPQEEVPAEEPPAEDAPAEGEETVDITSLSDEDLAAAATHLAEQFAAIYDADGDPTAEQVAELTALADQIEAVRAETERRVAETEANRAAAAALADRVAPPATPVVAEPEPTVEIAAAATVPAEDVLPRGRRLNLSLAEIRARAPEVVIDTPAPQHRLAITAAADLAGIVAGAEFDDLASIANAFQFKANNMPVGRLGDDAARGPVVQIQREHAITIGNAGADGLSQISDEQIAELMERATNVDVLTAAGGWCFGPGTLVQTPNGLVPIEDIQVDDEVIAGHGQARRVACVMNREADRYLLSVHGARTVTTPEHPMWARRARTTMSGNRVPSLAKVRWDEPAWVKAGDLKPGDQVAFSLSLPVSDSPVHRFMSEATDEVAEARAYLLGRYLGDGWTSRKRKAAGGRADMDASFVCSAHKEAEQVEKALISAEVGYSRREYPTVTQFALASEVRDWLNDLDCGRGAHDKRMPGEVFGWSEPLRAAMLRGYVDADGYTSAPGHQARQARVETTTTSRELAVGMAMLVRSLGFSAGVKQGVNPDSVIDGRTIHGGPYFGVTWIAGEHAHKRFEIADGCMWELVQSFERVDHGTVYDITVDDAEHSFIADGMVVHNCAPSTILYNLFNISADDGMWDVPTVGITRGGLKFPTSPALNDFLANIWLWTEASDIAAVTGGATKPCVRVPCPGFTDVRLEAHGLCVTAGMLTDASYPEATVNFVKLLMDAHRHVMNARHLANATAASTAVDVTSPSTGAAANLLAAVELQAIDYREKFGMTDDAILEVVLPRWGDGVVRADLSRRSGVDLLGVTDAQMNAWFDDRDVRVQYVADYQTRTTGFPGQATPLVAWPATINFLLYAPGTFALGEGPTINLGVIHDSVLNASNDFTAAWSEELTLVAKLGHESRDVEVEICADGSTGNTASALGCPIA